MSELGVILWDFSVLILVIFPLLTGGVWMRRPHLFIELSDVGLSILSVAILGSLFKTAWGSRLEKSRTFKMSSIFWARWAAFLEKSPWKTLGIAAGFNGLLWSLVSWIRYVGFGSHAYDLGIFTNAIWNLTHGNGYISSVRGGINLFADHQSPLFWVFAPAFYWFPDPRTLLVLQAFGLALGALPLYWLARQYLRPPTNSPEQRESSEPWDSRNWGPAAAPLLYWAYLPLRNANAFDFHPEVMMLPLFLAAICGLQSTPKNPKPRIYRNPRILGALAFLLALGAKESAGPIAFGVGLSWCLGAGPESTRSFTRRLGLIALVLGIAAFFFDLKVVPKLLGGTYAYAGLYRQYGSNALEVASFILRAPRAWIAQIFGPERLKFLFWTLAPLGFLPLLNVRTFFAVLPGFLMLFLSSGDHRVNLGYHYAIEPSVGLFWSLPGGLLALSRITLHSARGRKICAFGIALLALSTFGRSEMTRIRRDLPDSRLRWLSSRFLPCVNARERLAASDSYVPWLSNRPWVHGLDSIVDDKGQAVDCVIRDQSNGISNFPMSEGDFATLDRETEAHGYQRIYTCGALSVLARGAHDCLVCDPGCHPFDQ